MCSVMLPVTPNYDGRIIYRCEHGAYHLGWNRGMLHLSEGELKFLAALVSENDPIPQGIRGQNIRFFTHMTREGVTYFELWVREAGLRLSVADLEVLKSLVGEAIDWMEARPDAFERHAMRAGNPMMSLNLRSALRYVNMN